MCLSYRCTRPYGVTMLGRLLLVVSIVAALLAPASAGAAVPTSVIALSSWAPTTDGAVITGGTRTVTLVNATDATTTVDAFDLGPTPCTCRAITLDASPLTLESGAPGAGLEVPTATPDG